MQSFQNRIDAKATMNLVLVQRSMSDVVPVKRVLNLCNIKFHFFVFVPSDRDSALGFLTSVNCFDRVRDPDILFIDLDILELNSERPVPDLLRRQQSWPPCVLTGCSRDLDAIVKQLPFNVCSSIIKPIDDCKVFQALQSIIKGADQD
jgi:hypothetical protein